jgi:hypothetical protein
VLIVLVLVKREKKTCDLETMPCLVLLDVVLVYPGCTALSEKHAISRALGKSMRYLNQAFAVEMALG